MPRTAKRNWMAGTWVWGISSERVINSSDDTVRSLAGLDDQPGRICNGDDLQGAR